MNERWEWVFKILGLLIMILLLIAVFSFIKFQNDIKQHPEKMLNCQELMAEYNNKSCFQYTIPSFASHEGDG